MRGEIENAELDYILRDHDLAILKEREETMERIAAYLNGKYGEGTVALTLKESYRNMFEKILPSFYLIERAYDAIREAGGEPVSNPVRGGTDGSRLSFMGVPCPNLGTGSHNHHGKLEFAVTEEMDRSVDVLIGIARRFVRV